MSAIEAFLIGMIDHLRRAVAEFVVARARPPQRVWLGDRAFAPVVPPPRQAPLPDATWLLLHARLGRLAARVRSLFARWQAGTLKPTRVGGLGESRVSPPPESAAVEPRQRAPYTRLPTARGWISAHIDAAGPSGGPLHALLQRPEAPDFLAACPRAGRLLRPICRALAVDLPPWLKLPPRPRRARPKPARTVAAARTSRKTGGLAPTDRPLPRYVLAAARAWRRRP